ncbi:pyridoxal-phosphate dependent enzyme [Kineococcus indalonis]|uniref:pyridoxal-phosphate dependent enzyme n=1 Tax=Kineococcus indalonis TaxID=2696566 RepID=UPI0014129F6C|nr:pyridoxal-phosphate dependent enzyme [Kineococcus indalonis]NAZ84959.1 pyridoxal-phosphate dependent enzyme [Kineococcus indalonis]
MLQEERSSRAAGAATPRGGPLTFGPSPVHPLDRLSAHLGGARVWAKREDVNSGLAHGGNKTRELEHLVPEALAQGADTLVPIGGYQSNHTRQVAAVAAHLGLRAVQDVRAAGGTPHAIPAGASDHRLGGLGFARWAEEVRRQEEELGVFFDTVVVCSVTGSTQAGSTQAGMVAGFAAQDRPRRVIGIDASAELAETRAQVERIARRTADLIDLGRDLREDEVEVLLGWAGERYGVPVASTLEAIRLVGRLEGVVLDPVHEGKSMAGLVDLVRGGRIPPGSNVLFAHLGGQPALNACSALFRD